MCAVKYSKLPDFGAKGRKSLKMGGKMFTKREWFTKKTDAKKYAQKWRKRGKLARVVKESATSYHQKSRGKKYVWRVLTHGK